MLRVLAKRRIAILLLTPIIAAGCSPLQGLTALTFIPGALAATETLAGAAIVIADVVLAPLAFLTGYVLAGGGGS